MSYAAAHFIHTNDQRNRTSWHLMPMRFDVISIDNGVLSHMPDAFMIDKIVDFKTYASY
jgi:Holliday junction resolvase-like predicted endonuclease